MAMRDAMQKVMQKTLRDVCHITGIGIHSGEKACVSIHPADVDTGFQFYRTDCQVVVPVMPATIAVAARATVLQYQSVDIRTPEHLLAALAGLGITNAVIHIDTPEVPILDGSAQCWVDVVQSVGIQDQAQAIVPIVLKKTIRLVHGDAQLVAIPSDTYQLTYLLNYENTIMGIQAYHGCVSPDWFCRNVAAARTFGFRSELQPLLDRNLAQGATHDNVLVVEPDRYASALRFDNEPARHKLLDMIGDFALLGCPLQAHVIGIKSGHALNSKMVNAIHGEIIIDNPV